MVSQCPYCTLQIRKHLFGKYVVRFGCNIVQFCSEHCLQTYKRYAIVCTYCSTDILTDIERPPPLIVKKRHFCSRLCLGKYNSSRPNKKPCSVCREELPVVIEYEEDSKTTRFFCGQPCFIAYNFVNKIVTRKCNMCKKHYDHQVVEEHTIFFEGKRLCFCSINCQNAYIIVNGRLVTCNWCDTKKYVYDMIKRYFPTGSTLIMCSLQCFRFRHDSTRTLNVKK